MAADQASRSVVGAPVPEGSHRSSSPQLAHRQLVGDCQRDRRPRGHQPAHGRGVGRSDVRRQRRAGAEQYAIVDDLRMALSGGPGLVAPDGSTRGVRRRADGTIERY